MLTSKTGKCLPQIATLFQQSSNSDYITLALAQDYFRPGAVVGQFAFEGQQSSLSCRSALDLACLGAVIQRST